MIQNKFLIGMLLSVVLSLVTACQPVVMPSVITVAQPATDTAASSIYQATLHEEKPVNIQISTEDLQAILADGETFVFDSRPHL